ncbi:hypothetical protein DVH05_015713 [Phytophthora capsici]|nr:hypothetical protein DVH05_015713 [Phytophthora capsici]
MAQSNPRTVQPVRVAPNQLPIRIHYDTLVPARGNPRIKHLLGAPDFRRAIEHQASVEIGVQGRFFDWPSLALEPPVSESTHMEEWKQCAEPQQPRATIALKRIDESLINPDPMPTREPTMAQVMARLAAQDDKITAQGVKITEQNATIKRLRQDHPREINKLIEKLGETDGEAARMYTLQTAKIEKQQETIKKQGQQIKALISSSLHLLHRKMLDWFREKPFDRVGREEDGRKLSTKELIDRVREKKPHELSDWTLDRFSTESEYIHSRPTKEEARLVFDSNLGKDDANYQEIFRFLFPE